MGDYLFLKEAVRAGCKRFVYASTNHTQHGATMRSTPETLDSTKFGAHLSNFRLIRTDDPPAPDSFYAVGKLTGEALGRYYARVHGLDVVAVRIGTANLACLLCVPPGHWRGGASAHGGHHGWRDWH
jgi:L-arabinose 1-dehydrogenase [NAD(P)+]